MNKLKVIIFFVFASSAYTQEIIRLLSKQEQFNKRKKSVVRYSILDSKNDLADRANGFFISRDGYFVTSYHALKKLLKYEGWSSLFMTYENKEIGPFNVIKCSNNKNKDEKERDLCLLKLNNGEKVKNWIPLSDFYEKHQKSWYSEYGTGLKRDKKNKLKENHSDAYRCIGNPTGKKFEEVNVVGIRVHDNNFQDITSGIKTRQNKDLYDNKLIEVYDPSNTIRNSFSGGPCFSGKKLIGIITTDAAIYDYYDLKLNSEGKIATLKEKSRALLLISADEIKEFVKEHIK